jgi:hypothetical protein
MNTISHRYGVFNEALTKVSIHTEKAGIFNVIVTGVRKDPGAIAYSETIQIDGPVLCNKRM